MLRDGDLAPSFELKDATGAPLSLADFRGSWLVVYFYPRADTEGCTLEAREFTHLARSFAREGAAVLGLSPDMPSKLARFKAKHELAVALASDADTAVAKAYGVWVEKKMYGRTFMGVERATFLISPEGRIARIWRTVTAKGHAEEVLDALKQAIAAAR